MRDRLKHSYQEQCKNVQGVFGPPFPLDEQYIHLQLTHYTRVHERKQSRLPSSDETASTSTSAAELELHSLDLFSDQKVQSFSATHLKKRLLSLEQLFLPAKAFLDQKEYIDKKNSDTPPSCVVLRGDAGHGKTTSIHFMIRRWLEDKLWSEFSWVFLFTLRDLPKEGKADWDLCDWVYAVYCTGGEETLDKIQFKSFWTQTIKPLLTTRGVLFILDGLDELPSNNPFHKIVQTLQASDIPTLISSRPHGIENVQNDAHREVEVIGFLDENVENYIRFYWGEQNHAQAEEIIKKIKQLPVIWNMVHAPILLNTLCAVIKTSNQSVNTLLQDFKSLTQVYQAMEVVLFEKIYCAEKGKDALKGQSLSAKRDILYPYYRIERNVLAHVAFSAFIDNQLIISDETLEKSLSKKQIAVGDWGYFRQRLLRLGVLKLVGEPQHEVSNQRYEFLHLTLQEYYAAIYIALGLQSLDINLHEEVKKFIIDKKYNPRLQNTFWFVAGLIRNNEAIFVSYIGLINLQPKFDTIKISVGQNTYQSHDMFGHYELGLIVRSFEESKQEIPDELIGIVQKKIESYYNLFNKGLLPKKFASPLLDSLRLSPSWLNQQGNRDILKNIPPTEDYRILFPFISIVNFCTPKILSLLAKQLRHKNWNVRFAAMEVISHLGSLAVTTEILDELKFQLNDSNELVRRMAVEAIGNLGISIATPKTLEVLSQRLEEDNDGDVKLALTETIKKFGTLVAIPEFLAPLAKKLRDTNDWHGRLIAIKITNSLGKSASTPEIVNNLLECVKDNNKNIHEAALNALGVIEPSPEVIKKLEKDLENNDEKIRWLALLVIGAFSKITVTPEILKSIAKCMLDDCVDIRVASLIAINVLGENAVTSEILSGITQLLEDCDCDVRIQAICFIEKIGALAATPQILEILEERIYDGGKITEVAIKAIGKLGQAVIDTVLLDKLLQNFNNPELAWKVIKVLEELDSIAATPKILNVLTSQFYDGANNKVREAATFVIGKLSSKIAAPQFSEILCQQLEFLETLCQQLDNTDFFVRRDAAEALRNLGLSAATPQVLKALAQQLALKNNPNSIYFVLDAVGSLCQTTITPEILEILPQLLEDDSWSIRVHTITTLAKLGSLAKTPEISGALLRRMNDKSTDVRMELFSQLKSSNLLILIEDKQKFLNALSQQLRRNDQYVLHYVIGATANLGSIGATPEIIDAFSDLLSKGVNLTDQLSKLGVEAVTPKILDILTQQIYATNAGISEVAIKTVGKLGPTAATPPILDALVQKLSLSNNNHSICSVILMTIGQLGSVAITSKFLIKLFSLLKSNNLDIRSVTIEFIEKLGSKLAIPKFLEMLSLELVNNDWVTFNILLEALEKVGSVVANPQICKALAGRLDSDNKNARIINLLKRFAKQLLIPTFQDFKSSLFLDIDVEYLAILVCGAYMAGDVSCEIYLNDKTERYFIRGFVSKELYEISITMIQAQYFYNVISMIVSKFEMHCTIVKSPTFEQWSDMNETTNSASSPRTFKDQETSVKSTPEFFLTDGEDLPSDSQLQRENHEHIPLLFSSESGQAINNPTSNKEKKLFTKCCVLL